MTPTLDATVQLIQLVILVFLVAMNANIRAKLEAIQKKLDGRQP